MPPKIRRNKSPFPPRHPGWRDHEDPIEVNGDGQPKPTSERRTTIMVLDEPPRDGAPVPPELDGAAPRTAHSAGEG